MDTGDQTVVVAVRNDIQRYGLERLLAAVPATVRGHHDITAAVTDHPDAVVLGVLQEIADPEAFAAGRGARVLLLVDPASFGTAEAVSALAVSPSIGFLLPDDLGDPFPAIVRAALAGTLPIPPALARELLVRSTQSRPRPPRLTPRETQVLTLLTQGLSNRQIARRLGVSEHGAKRHVASILGKLNCPNRTGAVALALSQGLCGPVAV
jgi:DNA-binding NarL/FixJ family response regulator